MRTACFDCCRKHLAKAWIQIESFPSLTGDALSLALWRAVGEMAEAEDEILSVRTDLAALIRTARLSLLKEQAVDIPSLILTVTSAVDQPPVTSVLVEQVRGSLEIQLLTCISQATVNYTEVFKGYPHFIGLVEAQLIRAAAIAGSIGLTDVQAVIVEKVSEIQKNPSSALVLDNLLLSAYNKITELAPPEVKVP